MKTRKLRLVSALLALAMLFALMPTAAFAADSTENNIITYNCGENGNNNVVATLDTVTGVMTISGTGKMADYDKNAPPWENYKGDIKHLVVKNGVTSIGDGAFRDCDALIDADMSKASSLEVIKTSFPGCDVLESVKLNEGLVEIGGSAFNSCKNLKKIHIPSTVTAIGGWCFEECSGLKEVTFADGINLTTIAGATFIYCSGLKKITIPKSVKLIKKDGISGAFEECTDLESVIFEHGSELTTVEGFAFYNCNKLTIYCSNEDKDAKNALSKVVSPDRIKPTYPTVTFISNGGSDVAAKSVKNGDAISAPAAPTREGWNFAGWYTKKDGNWAEKPFNFDTLIMDNMTLYARWETGLVPITPAVELYPITIDYGTAYDAEGNPIEKAAAGDVVTIKADETALEGMTFERWEVRKGEVKLADDHAAKTSFTMPAGEVQLEAMYQAADVHDSGWDAATVVTGAVIGTGTAILAYHIGMEVYAEQVLGKGVAVPRTRSEVALLAWQLAGSPAVNVEGEPLSEAAQAERWAVESGLMQPDAEGNFNGTKKMSKWNALRVLDAAKKQV